MCRIRLFRVPKGFVSRHEAAIRRMAGGCPPVNEGCFYKFYRLFPFERIGRVGRVPNPTYLSLSRQCLQAEDICRDGVPFASFCDIVCVIECAIGRVGGIAKTGFGVGGMGWVANGLGDHHEDACDHKYRVYSGLCGCCLPDCRMDGRDRRPYSSQDTFSSHRYRCE